MSLPYCFLVPLREGPQGESNPHRLGGTARGRRALEMSRKRLHAGHSAVATRNFATDRLGLPCSTRSQQTEVGARRTSSRRDEPFGSGSTHRGKRIVASVPVGDRAQRKEKPHRLGVTRVGEDHVRGSHAAETVAQDAARSHDEEFSGCSVTFATDCLVNPNDSAVGAARGFFSIIGGGGGLLTRKGVVRRQCGRLGGKRTAACDGKSRTQDTDRIRGRSDACHVPVGVENEESVTT
ncbi:hypothetical protein TNCT_224391 [Trichonephila clavata]|uniref:Uncharacterized protein n=1 Tax=Trichonephila clavata TaxID=2740835 RepID=A0A8X6GIL0_TRICU|nr:hypothetical protein TNCT_224391 [Trichonephila clavata]